jgi:hypothetical protein
MAVGHRGGRRAAGVEGVAKEGLRAAGGLGEDEPFRNHAGIAAPAGARQAGSTWLKAARRVARSMRGKRPLGVTFVSVGFLALALGLGLVGLLLLVARSPAAEAEAGAFLGAWWPSAMAGLTGPVFLASAAVVGAVGVGLLRGRRWAWMGALAVAGVAALSGVVGLAMGERGSLLGVLVWAGVGFYLLQPEARRHLGSG